MLVLFDSEIPEERKPIRHEDLKEGLKVLVPTLRSHLYVSVVVGEDLNAYNETSKMMYTLKKHKNDTVRVAGIINLNGIKKLQITVPKEG